MINMKNEPREPRKDPGLKRQPGYDKQPADETPRREGGDDALAESDPTDSRLDEKVIVNEQRSDKITNAPPQAGANTSEVYGNDDEIVNG